jgi:type I restriction enzyme, S subunit
LPPDEEIDRIVAFLDQKTAEIDALIAKKQRQIELLDEQKAILINRAVTRGLNPNAKLKPSGIEWIGDIPEHWEVRRYAHISRIVRGGSPRPAGHPAFFSSESGTPWITVGEVTKKQGQYLTKTREFLTPRGAKQSRFIEPGTLLLSNSGATLGVPTVTKIGGCINDGVLAFLEINEERCLLDYLYNHLSTLTAFYRDRLKQGSGQPNLNTDLVKDTAVALPPTKREQREICDRIKEIAADAEATVIAYDRQIQSLKTLRSTLIAHAVTGRIKV